MQTLVNRCKTKNDEKFNASIADRVASVFLQACAEVSIHMLAEITPVFPMKTGFFYNASVAISHSKGIATVRFKWETFFPEKFPRSVRSKHQKFLFADQRKPLVQPV
jgi:hypothetical protein